MNSLKSSSWSPFLKADRKALILLSALSFCRILESAFLFAFLLFLGSGTSTPAAHPKLIKLINAKSRELDLGINSFSLIAFKSTLVHKFVCAVRGSCLVKTSDPHLDSTFIVFSPSRQLLICFNACRSWIKDGVAAECGNGRQEERRCLRLLGWLHRFTPLLQKFWFIWLFLIVSNLSTGLPLWGYEASTEITVQKKFSYAETTQKPASNKQ